MPHSYGIGQVHYVFLRGYYVTTVSGYVQMLRPLGSNSGGFQMHLRTFCTTGSGCCVEPVSAGHDSALGVLRWFIKSNVSSAGLVCMSKTQLWTKRPDSFAHFAYGCLAITTSLFFLETLYIAQLQDWCQCARVSVHFARHPACVTTSPSHSRAKPQPRNWGSERWRTLEHSGPCWSGVCGGVRIPRTFNVSLRGESWPRRLDDWGDVSA